MLEGTRGDALPMISRASVEYSEFFWPISMRLTSPDNVECHLILYIVPAWRTSPLLGLEIWSKLVSLERAAPHKLASRIA